MMRFLKTACLAATAGAALLGMQTAADAGFFMPMRTFSAPTFRYNPPVFRPAFQPTFRPAFQPAFRPAFRQTFQTPRTAFRTPSSERHFSNSRSVGRDRMVESARKGHGQERRTDQSRVAHLPERSPERATGAGDHRPIGPIHVGTLGGVHRIPPYTPARWDHGKFFRHQGERFYVLNGRLPYLLPIGDAAFDMNDYIAGLTTDDMAAAEAQEPQADDAPVADASQTADATQVADASQPAGNAPAAPVAHVRYAAISIAGDKASAVWNQPTKQDVADKASNACGENANVSAACKTIVVAGTNWAAAIYCQSLDSSSPFTGSGKDGKMAIADAYARAFDQKYPKDSCKAESVVSADGSQQKFADAEKQAD